MVTNTSKLVTISIQYSPIALTPFLLHYTNPHLIFFSFSSTNFDPPTLYLPKFPPATSTTTFEFWDDKEFEPHLEPLIPNPLKMPTQLKPPNHSCSFTVEIICGSFRGWHSSASWISVMTCPCC